MVTVDSVGICVRWPFSGGDEGDVGARVFRSLRRCRPTGTADGDPSIESETRNIFDTELSSPTF